MQKDLLKSKLSLKEAQVGYELDDREEEEGEEDDFDCTASLNQPKLTSRKVFGKSKDYSPLSASGYFEEALEVTIDTSSNPFRVYYTPPPPPPTSSSSASTSSSTISSPSLSSSLAPATAPWLKLPSTIDKNQKGKGKGVVFVCVHGAGYSGLSYACLAKELTGEGSARVGVLSYDARGHGKSQFDSPEMSLESMSNDLVLILKKIFPTRSEAPSVLLVGHSMGGAVVADACTRIQTEVTDVSGLVIIDVVEGSALDALVGMTSLVANQPKGFESIEKAIEWHIRTKTLNNLASARISVPPLFIKNEAVDVKEGENFIWRADLIATEPYWIGWFTGLSAKFLSCKTAKLLILAGADRLDKELMIGQMQGKYQLEVFPEVGHCVQEDAPEKTAEVLLSFWTRNDRTDVLAGVKKVGQI